MKSADNSFDKHRIEPLDIGSIERLASGDVRADGVPIIFPSSDGSLLVDDMATMMGAGDSNPCEVFLQNVYAAH